MTPMTRWFSLALVLSALGAVALGGCLKPAPPAGKSGASQRSATGDGAGTERGTEVNLTDGRPSAPYTEIADRNIFRPLVVRPKGPEGAPSPPSTVAKTGPEAGKAGNPASGKAGGPGMPPRPLDPLADLALTGVTEVGGRLQALIEHISTRLGQYVAVGERIDGFGLKSIQATSVVLEKGGKEYTLRMGAKEVPGGPSLTAPSTMSGPPGGFGPPGGRFRGFGGPPDPDMMLRFADRMSLEQVERMIGAFRDRMTPEQRARADAYLAKRRAQGK
jgi:hypothetical protein